MLPTCWRSPIDALAHAQRKTDDDNKNSLACALLQASKTFSLFWWFFFYSLLDEDESDDDDDDADDDLPLYSSGKVYRRETRGRRKEHEWEKDSKMKLCKKQRRCEVKTRTGHSVWSKSYHRWSSSQLFPRCSPVIMSSPPTLIGVIVKTILLVVSLSLSVSLL